MATFLLLFPSVGKVFLLLCVLLGQIAFEVKGFLPSSNVSTLSLTGVSMFPPLLLFGRGEERCAVGLFPLPQIAAALQNIFPLRMLSIFFYP